MIDAINRQWPASVFSSQGYLLGDKDTWLLGAMLTEADVAVSPHGAGVLAISSVDGGTLHIHSGHAQCDADGRPLYYNAQRLDEQLERLSADGFGLLRWIRADELQLHGGYGYLMDYPVERFWRDLRVHSILEGTNQVMRMIVARDMLRQG